MLPVRSTVPTPPRVLRVATTSYPELPLKLRAELKTQSKREFPRELMLAWGGASFGIQDGHRTEVDDQARGAGDHLAGVCDQTAG